MLNDTAINLLKNIFIKVYLIYHYAKQFIYKSIIRLFGPIDIVYHIDHCVKNITLNYYSGIGLRDLSHGHFIITRYDLHHKKYCGFTGDLSQINDIALEENLHPRSKKITLLRDSQPIDSDITVLDNYTHNITKNNLNHEINLSSITKVLGINCTHIKLLTMNPFKQTTMSIDELSIHDIYN